jgi:hypothetical protein
MPLTKVASSMLASGDSGSGGSAGKNYISSYNNNSCNGDFESGSISGWSVFSVSSITNGLPSGAPSIISSPGVNDPALSLLSSGQLAGQYSLQAAFPTTAIREGFISDIFTIDSQDQAKVLTFTFYYQLASSSGAVNFSGTASNAFIVAIYDVTNSTVTPTWIQPAGVYSMTQSSGAGIATGTFQTTSNSTQYRFAILCASVTGWTGSATLKFDDFSLGPLTAPIGAPVNDWVDRGLITLTAVTANPSKGTTSIDKVLMRRVGDSAQFLYNYAQTAAGASAGTGDYLFSLPAGMSIDTSKIQLVSGGFIRSGNTRIGSGTVSITTSGTTGNVDVYPYSATQVILYVSGAQDTTGAISSAVDEAVGSGVFPTTTVSSSYKFTFTVPIVGWSSNVQMSNDTDTRVVAAILGPSTSISVASGATSVIYTGIPVVLDTHGAFSSGTTYTVPVSGAYRISARSSFNATAGAGQSQAIVRLFKNGTNFKVIGHRDVLAAEASGVTSYINGSTIVNLIAGETLTFSPFQDSGVARSSCQLVDLSINRLSGPSVVAATETVAASYSASTSASSSTSQAINFDLKEYDTHNAVTPGVNWRYTAPVSGTYLVTIYVNASAGTASYFNIYKNSISTIYKSIGYANTTTVGSGATSLKLNAGDYIGIYTSASFPYFGNASLNTQNTSHITIIRTGN